MGRGRFTAAEGRKRLALAVKDVESQTSAEIVVAVRRHSGDYAAADLRFAALAAFVALLTVHLLPEPFEDAAFVVDTTLFFLLALLASSRLPTLRRLFTSRATRNENVRTAALAAFVAQGVGRLAHRNGVLVYASQLERVAIVVPDIGVEVDRLGASWREAVSHLEVSLSPTLDLDAFDSALRALGPLLARILPHRDDDVNELPDEAVVE